MPRLKMPEWAKKNKVKYKDYKQYKQKVEKVQELLNESLEKVKNLCPPPKENYKKWIFFYDREGYKEDVARFFHELSRFHTFVNTFSHKSLNDGVDSNVIYEVGIYHFVIHKLKILKWVTIEKMFDEYNKILQDLINKIRD